MNPIRQQGCKALWLHRVLAHIGSQSKPQWMIHYQYTVLLQTAHSGGELDRWLGLEYMRSDANNGMLACKCDAAPEVVPGQAQAAIGVSGNK